MLVLGAVLCVYVACGSRRIPKLLRLRWRWMLLLAFGLNVSCVSIPGRFDSPEAAESMTFPWPSIFMPAGWAFAIWCVGIAQGRPIPPPPRTHHPVNAGASFSREKCLAHWSRWVGQS